MKFYIGSVCIKCTSSIKNGSTSKRLCMVVWVSLISWLNTPCFPPGFFINIETCTRNFKDDIMLVTKDPLNTWMFEQIQLKDKWKLNAGILLHHNFMSCKGFSWITSGPLPQKEGNSCRVHVRFSVWNWHFFPRNWTMHILDQVFLRKNVDYIVKKVTSAQSFLSSCYSTQHLYVEWSCN